MPKRNSKKEILFSDYPDFRPNLTPREIFEMGSFGGTYWRPIKSSITKKNYENEHKKFPKSWWDNISDEYLVNNKCNKKLNKYNVTSGTSLIYWEKKEWITKYDPYGWIQWYCNFYKGRRIKHEDDRQINRWLRFTGEKGRFRIRLINLIKKNKKNWDDINVSPVIRQGLQQWAYKLNKYDFDKNN